MEKHEAYVGDEPIDGATLMKRREALFTETQMSWVSQSYAERTRGQRKDQDQIYVETTIENYVKAYQGRKDGSGRVRPSIRFED
jgi:hypothetical protein